MTTETSVQNLKINKLTSAQYNTITPSSTELYMVTDDNSYQEKLVSGTNIKTINNESLLGSGNITIQAGGTSLPDQTGKAGLYLQTDGSNPSWQGVPSRNIGEIVSSTIPLTDAGLHLLDGALIQGSGIYSDFVDYIASIYDATANYFCTESEWQTSVTTYGVCGKFVYNSTNNTVRLPKLYSTERYLIDSYSSGGDWYRIYSDGWCEQGGQLLNGSYNTPVSVTFLKPFTDANYTITGMASSEYTTYPDAFVGWYWGTKTATSISLWARVVANAVPVSYTWQASGYINISNYQNAEKYEYIVIATSTKTDIEVDIDEVATDLNGKADVDLSNLSNGLANTICTTPATTTSTASSATPAVVVENYVNGTSWYRVYSDGWCEQGGTVSGGYVQVYFLKPYVNANYNIQATISSTSEGGCAYAAAGQRGAVTPTYFEIWGANGVGYKFWYTAGYIR